MARAIRTSGMREAPLSELQDDLSRFPREAEIEDIVITRQGKPIAVLIGFASEDNWSDIVWRMIRAFCAASTRRATACAPAAASGSRMSRGNRRAERRAEIQPTSQVEGDGRLRHRTPRSQCPRPPSRVSDL
jgi:prevent-host-death family protein